MPKLTAYCLDWHTSNKSDAFLDLLVRPLAPYANIDLAAWDGRITSLPLAHDNWQDIHIFCQLPPPVELLQDPHARLVWIPMWDSAQGYDQAWWNALPKTLRIVAFSDTVARRAEAAQLPTLRLRYFLDPATMAPAQWDQGRVLLYWNRIGMVAPNFLERLCHYLKIDRLIFRSDLDPHHDPTLQYALPERIGKTTVESSSIFMKKEDYLKQLNRANIFLASRLSEGVGLSFLEAMAAGCAVIGYNAPTMNEYIQHGKNGILLSSDSPLPLQERIYRAYQTRTPHWKQQLRRPLSEFQDWRSLARLPLEELGAHARKDQAQGYAIWRKMIPEYARMVLNWEAQA